MDETQNEETETYPKATAYVVMFSTIAAAGMITGASIVAGAELAGKAKDKIKKLREDRAAKKAAKTED